ncbi:MAG: hypothetical protein K2K48_01525 [Anaeroplasmataceae bacterium]|nr:hypothetical protein [Anaeroplasmataceae bacterium]MDE6414071.1 hypothetical protein [Anaeroplasmataceae bacterium]
MKPFIFDDEEYQDLNSLGLAFVNKFDLALQAIKEKTFVKFFKGFKSYKKQIQSILYQSRYLQNALSMIIYLVTEDHIFYVGHRRYLTISSILSDIKKNSSFKYFAEDHGFSNTILSTLEDEKLKADLKAFEDNFSDDFSLDYFEGYMSKDSIEPITSHMSSISSSKDPFKEALHVFQSRRIQLALAYRYSLAQVLDLRKRNCPVFAGFSIVNGEFDLPLSILEKAFYTSLLTMFKDCKYKGLEGHLFRKKIKASKKAFKKYNKLGDSSKINYQEKLHTLYLEWVDLFKLEKVLISDSDLEPTIPYCNTYVSSKLLEEFMLTRDMLEKPYTPVLQVEYDLRKLEKSLKNHWYFSFWSILIAVLITIEYLFVSMIPALQELVVKGLSQIFDKKKEEVEALPSNLHIYFFVGIGVAILVAIFIFVLRSLAKKKYNGLCRLSYYRKNEAILLEKEQKDFEKLKLNEARYAKKIDRFYRFYGGIGMAGLSFAITLATLGLLYTCGFILNEALTDIALKLLQTNLYYLFIGPVICLLLGFLRHKKTAWSILFTYIFSIAIAVGLTFIVKA